MPLPNSGAGEVQNLTSVEASESDVDQFSVRIDQRIGTSDQAFVRFSTFDAHDLQPFGTSVQQETLIPGFGRTLSTRTRNLAASYTRAIGTSMLNETRFGWMSVDGGQESLNRGVDFAGRVGLLGVTRDPRDVGFPQIDTGGLYSAMGDPTSFVFRRNEHFEIYNNFLIDRGAHRLKFGAYWFHLRFRPENADTARGRFLYTGRFSGNPFADFLLGYPVQARSGVGGRGDEDARTNWLHLYAQDDWRLRDDLTLNVGLRYEINQHMRDVDNRLSTIDVSVPGGRYVIASDDDGNISPAARGLLPLIPIPWVTSAEIGWDRSLLRPSKTRFAPRLGFAWVPDDEGRTVVRGGYGIFLNQWAYSVQTAFTRNLPFFFLKQVDVPADRFVPSFDTRTMLASDPTGRIGGSIMDYDFQVEYTQTWSGGFQTEVLPSTVFELFYMGSYTIGADNSTIHNVPQPGRGSISARRDIPQLSGIRAIRFDGKSIYHAVTFKLLRRLRGDLAFDVAYTLSRSEDDASSPGPTAFEANVPQDVRNIFPGENALSSFDHRHQFVGSASYELPFQRRAGGWREGVLGHWRLNAIVTAQSGAPFTVNVTGDRANIGAGPAQRPDMTRDPNLPGGERTVERWFDTEAFALQAPFTFGSAPRNPVFAPGFANVDLAVAKSWLLGNGSRLEFRWEIFNLLNRANFDLPNRFFGSPNFGRIFSALQRARDAVRPALRVLGARSLRRGTCHRGLRASADSRRAREGALASRLPPEGRRHAAREEARALLDARRHAGRARHGDGEAELPPGGEHGLDALRHGLQAPAVRVQHVAAGLGAGEQHGADVALAELAGDLACVGHAERALDEDPGQQVAVRRVEPPDVRPLDVVRHRQAPVARREPGIGAPQPRGLLVRRADPLGVAHGADGQERLLRRLDGGEDDAVRTHVEHLLDHPDVRLELAAGGRNPHDDGLARHRVARRGDHAGVHEPLHPRPQRADVVGAVLHVEEDEVDVVVGRERHGVRARVDREPEGDLVLVEQPDEAVPSRRIRIPLSEHERGRCGQGAGRDEGQPREGGSHGPLLGCSEHLRPEPATAREMVHDAARASRERFSYAGCASPSRRCGSRPACAAGGPVEAW